VKNGKAMRTGITTGTCAAAAARAAMQLLLTGRPAERVELALPGGGRLVVPIERCRMESSSACAAVRKDAGGDADATDALEVVAEVGLGGPGERVPPGAAGELDGVRIIAGPGVGVVTLPGLQIPPGEPAVNPVPRRMIVSALRELTARACWVCLSVPGGAETAERTFNPRLGVVGGISILGTTGIVRPYSQEAIRDTIRCSLRVAAACGVRRPVLCPGNIGARSARRLLGLTPQQLVEVSNEWSCAMDELPAHPFEAVLLVGHPGKLAKLARGEWDTHSSRSQPAAAWVTELARGLENPRRERSREAASGCGPHRCANADGTKAPRTVEGVFASLTGDERRRLGDEIASRVATAARNRLAGGEDACSVPVRASDGGVKIIVSVLLIDMQGNELGASGEVDAWRKAQ